MNALRTFRSLPFNEYSARKICIKAKVFVFGVNEFIDNI